MDTDGFSVVGAKHKNRKRQNKRHNIPIVPHGKLTTSHIAKYDIQCVNSRDTIIHEKIRTSQKPDSQSRQIHVLNTEQNANWKKILCNNMFVNHICPYGDNCVYAHSLDEQRVDPIRRKAYDIIKGTTGLELLDLSKDTELYDALLSLSRTCSRCINGTCFGGYNCKNGACKIEYTVCAQDLNFGKCTNKTCKKVHLSRRGLHSFYHPCDTEEAPRVVVEAIKNCIQNDINFPPLCRPNSIHDMGTGEPLYLVSYNSAHNITPERAQYGAETKTDTTICSNNQNCELYDDDFDMELNQNIDGDNSTNEYVLTLIP